MGWYGGRMCGMVRRGRRCGMVEGGRCMWDGRGKEVIEGVW